MPLMKVEVGLLLGVALLLMGFGWSIGLVREWQLSGYGPMDPGQTMRSAIPAVTLMILGVQAAAGALFAGALHFCWISPKRVTLT